MTLRADRAHADGIDGSVAVRAAGAGPCVSNPAATQASSPPASGRTFSNPLDISARATRAAVASLGHVQ